MAASATSGLYVSTEMRTSCAARDLPHERDDPVDLLGDRNRRAAADRRLPAHVDDLRPGGDQLGGAGGQVGMVPRVRERVGRRVDHAHQQRRPAELQLATARAQPHVMWSLTFLIRRLPATSYTVTLSVNVPLRYACRPLKRLRCLTTRFESP